MMLKVIIAPGDASKLMMPLSKPFLSLFIRQCIMKIIHPIAHNAQHIVQAIPND